MSTLDPHGMVTPYRVNRPLSIEEETHCLKTKKPASNRPHYELSLIRFNGTFVESVDKWFAMRGFVAMGGVAIGSVCVLALFYAVSFYFENGDFFSASILFVALLGVAIYLFTRDAFTYTHYPIRFNRKNRQVYVFRRDGTVLKAAWDHLYFTIYGHNVGFRDLYVVGHVLGEDRKTIKETFALSCVTSGAQGIEQLKNHFEFYRRYMEEGPQEVLQAIKPLQLIMLPRIDQKRETWAFGWERLTLNINGFLLAQVIFQVFFLPMSFFRWFAMRTSKIPRWPKWVEQECAVETGDLWVRDGTRSA
jgi:hypothetical protein